MNALLPICIAVFALAFMVQGIILRDGLRRIKTKVSKLETELESLAEVTSQAVKLLGGLDASINCNKGYDYAVFLGLTEVARYETADEAKSASEKATSDTGAIHTWGVSN